MVEEEEVKAGGKWRRTKSGFRTYRRRKRVKCGLWRWGLSRRRRRK